MRTFILLSFSLFAILPFAFSDENTFSVLSADNVPRNVDELWQNFDPRSEPLDVEILKEWEEDGVVLKVLRYRVGIFKGKKAMVAAVYGYPKGGVDVPGLVQLHGGGQYANSNAVLTNAKRGYATLSVAWAGRIDAPGYKVTPDTVKLFFEEKTSDPAYKVTTDWGALDGYHAPARYEKVDTMGAKPTEWTLDNVDSPRNAQFFLWTLAARRGLTFLERQEQVDSDRLGVYGHSMGGRITVFTAGIDERVKAAAPSCGGLSGSPKDDLVKATLADAQYLKRIACPIMFLSPSNDFHGRVDDLQTAFRLIKTDEWRATCSPHHSHQDVGKYEVATQLWFDQHLKETFKTPETPRTTLSLKGNEGIPVFEVRPDEGKPVLYVDIYYTQQGQIDGKEDVRDNTVSRFWHHVTAEKQNGVWVGAAPVFDTAKPLWIFANVTYPLDEPISGAGYYYRDYTVDTFNLSSKMDMVLPDELLVAGVKKRLKASMEIEDFQGDWKKEWFTYRPEEMQIKTHKVYDPQFAAPVGARLVLDVISKNANKLVVGIDGYAIEVKLVGGGKIEHLEFELSDFNDVEGATLSSWNGIMELRLGGQETLKDKKKGLQVKLGDEWEGDKPVFQNLRWEL